MNLNDFLTIAGSAITFAAAAAPIVKWAIDRKAAEGDPRQFPVVVISDDEATAAALLGELEAEHWTVRRGKTPRKGEMVILAVADPGAIALALDVTEGLIYTTGRVSVPAGRWNLANSLVTLSPRLAELAQARIRRQRARR